MFSLYCHEFCMHVLLKIFGNCHDIGVSLQIVFFLPQKLVGLFACEKCHKSTINRENFWPKKQMWENYQPDFLREWLQQSAQKKKIKNCGNFRYLIWAKIRGKNLITPSITLWNFFQKILIYTFDAKSDLLSQNTHFFRIYLFFCTICPLYNKVNVLSVAEITYFIDKGFCSKYVYYK